MPSSTSSFERKIPDLPWARILAGAALLLVSVLTGAELRCRATGEPPTVNDTEGLWAQRRRAVRPDSIVIIGDSRALLDFDLDEMEKTLGRRPIQLAISSSSAYPVLRSLTDDPAFHGVVVCGYDPYTFFAPPRNRFSAASLRAVDCFHSETPADRVGEELAIPIERHLAFLDHDEFSVGSLLARIPVPHRPGTSGLDAPTIPFFYTLDPERRARMTGVCASPGPVQDTLRQFFLSLFTELAPADRRTFARARNRMIRDRFTGTVGAVGALRGRGGDAVFVGCPVAVELRDMEEKLTPRETYWQPLERALQPSHFIYFSDHPELAGFQPPDWSHLSADDSVEFTRRLTPYLTAVLRNKL